MPTVSDALGASPRRYGLVLVAVVLVMGLFVGVSLLFGRAGFPLDDAWIHQTYARNLVRNGRWEFVPGTASAGSTAPLWTLLIAVGHLFRFPPVAWSHLLGGLSLLALALSAMDLWRQLWPDARYSDWLAGLAVVFTWPLIWAAGSGMETLLFAALGLLVLSLYCRLGTDRASTLRLLVLAGLATGLLILTRPDGLVLLVILGLALSLKQASIPRRAGRLFVLLAGSLLPLIPYFAFNYWASGTIWPNTFYAKQAEYASLLAHPLWSRFLQLTFFSLGGPPAGWRGISGPHLLLLPGLLLAAWQTLRRDWSNRQLRLSLPLLWAGGHVLLYAWRLPVTYQHGRYLMAAMPVWVLFGLSGWRHLLQMIPAGERMLWMTRRFAQTTFVVMTAVFLLLGAQAYGSEVAFIEGEMVTVARWLAQNTAADAVIASHDIGAIGYFAERPLLDLAGLISPEVIPLLADEDRLSAYILASKADYLVTAPGWPYAQVRSAAHVQPLYSTDYGWTLDQGLNNMIVYRLAPEG